MKPDVAELDLKIQALKAAAEALHRAGENVPAVQKNTERIQASLKMLEITISDIASLGTPQKSS